VLVLETTPKLDDEALILENIAILLLRLLLLPTTENNPNFALKFTSLKQCKGLSPLHCFQLLKDKGTKMERAMSFTSIPSEENKNRKQKNSPPKYFLKNLDRILLNSAVGWQQFVHFG